jgi:hypothetical protein
LSELYQKRVTELIQERFSVRTYGERPIAEEKQQRLQQAMAMLRSGPLGTALRFALLAATEADRQSLKGLGTYGLIKGPTGFLAGAARRAPKDLEDYGWGLERLILLATDLELGTCWLGGFFTRSGFAKKLSLAADEILPAVASIGYIADPEQARNALFRRRVGSLNRLPWERLFFAGALGVPLSQEAAGPYAEVLEMVRLGPSASNKQPWRIVRQGDAWHFFLQRTRGYPGGLAARLVKVADIQRVDMGIAMSHFELTAQQLGLQGRWVVREPAIAKPDSLTEYTVSWVG